MSKPNCQIKWFLIITIFGLLGMLNLSSCSKILDEVGQEDIQLPTSAAKNIKDLISYFEVVELINSTHSSNGINRVNFDSLERKINCNLEIIDSLISDGDGYQYKVIFPKKTKIDASVQNYDGLTRFGTFLVDLNFNYRELNAQSTVTIDSTDQCFIGKSDGELTQIWGSVKFQRFVTNKINLLFNQVYFSRKNLIHQLTGSFDLIWLAGETSDGIENDNIAFSGSGIGVYINDAYRWKTNLAIEKNYELGCESNLIKGILQIEPTSNDKVFKIDFDPFNNKSCDSIIKIYILGKEYEVNI